MAKFIFFDHLGEGTISISTDLTDAPPLELTAARAGADIMESVSREMLAAYLDEMEDRCLSGDVVAVPWWAPCPA